MNENEKLTGKPLTKFAMQTLEKFIAARPEVASYATGVSALIEDMKAVVTIINTTPVGIVSKAIELLPLVEKCPQIFLPGVNLETYTKDLLKAAELYLLYTEDEKDLPHMNVI